MKLTQVTIKDYRSFAGVNEFELKDGVNCFVGPNNCGKSNLFNAISLALDASVPYSRERDVPAFAPAVKVSQIGLTFVADPRNGPERTLLERAAAYETSVNGGRATYADEGEIRFVVSLRAGGRQERFQARGAGGRLASPDSKEFRQLESQFRQVHRFVYIRSGESLESLLQGRFREILNLVINEHLGLEAREAEGARGTYISALQESVLMPLRDRISSVVGDVFPEISTASLIPNIPSLSKTLSEIEVRLTDTAETDLHGKGTGVRVAVLTAILQYLVEQTRRSIILAIEEPEAFLHPAAQEDLRHKLERLALRPDVTLLVTTHSPFIVTRQAEGCVTGLRKEGIGKTVVTASQAGDESTTDLVGGLFRDAGTASLIDRALSVPIDARAVVIFEGTSDLAYARTAVAVCSRAELLDGIHLVPAGGALKTVLQTVMLADATSLPVLTVLDSDENGRDARDKLKRFREGAVTKVSSKWLAPEMLAAANKNCQHPVEAEDLWPQALFERFLKFTGEAGNMDSRVACGNNWHIGLTWQGKDAFVAWLPENVRPAECARWIDLLETVAKRVSER